MGKINIGKVIVGGIVAGIVMNVFDFVLQGVILKPDWDAAMAAMNKPPMASDQIMWYVGFDFIVGIILVWLYGAIRPRFGAGVKTAVIAGLTAWSMGYLIPSLFAIPADMLPMKLITWPLFGSLVYVPISTVAGAAIYKE
ncbi:MAG: hypothetical protein EXR93_03550 [Gemmatimonadetes bacterium]|nr:hypothetical protein [Gemmatimonadota bacterium]